MADLLPFLPPALSSVGGLVVTLLGANPLRIPQGLRRLVSILFVIVIWLAHLFAGLLGRVTLYSDSVPISCLALGILIFIAVVSVHVRAPVARAGAAWWWLEYGLFIAGLAALSTGMAIHLESAKKVVLVADSESVQVYKKDGAAATILGLRRGLHERGLIFSDSEFQMIDRVKTMDDSADIRSSDFHYEERGLARLVRLSP